MIALNSVPSVPRTTIINYLVLTLILLHNEVKFIMPSGTKYFVFIMTFSLATKIVRFIARSS